jgi:hypothetical protein
MKGVKELGFALAIVCMQCSGAEAKCSMANFEGFSNQAVDGRLVVSSGAHCTIQLKYSAGPTYGFRTVQPPSHGSVSVGNNRITYRSRSGYVGTDLFVFESRGESLYGTPSTYTARVYVTVTAR